ncbi:MAG: HAMP domain-containing histidine kinase [Bryobacter sp.]|nr:HAMP domain-containing histidine kinase [Bryobacter sp.]
MGRQSNWSNGRPVALLFAATIVLPALVLAGLAWRVLDADRQLASQLWRERLQDASRRAAALLERKALDARARSEALSREAAPSGAAWTEAILAPELQVAPPAAFAWLPDGSAPRRGTLPPELERAETAEIRDPKGAGERYRDLLTRAPAAWRGWVHLRLARALSRVGEEEAALAELRRAAALPDAPSEPPSQFAARFELAQRSPAEAARLFQDLSAGKWVLEKSPYAFYEEQLRTQAHGHIAAETLAAAQRRQAMSRLLERVLRGESGWLTESPVTALITASSDTRKAAVWTSAAQWEQWLAEAARDAPRDIAIRTGTAPPAGAISLGTIGLPWSLWAEPRDPAAPLRENENRRRVMLAILLLVAGVLLFGTIATVRLVRRELHVAQLQADFAATVSHEFRSPLTGIRQLAEMLLAGRAANDEARRRRYYEMICRESDRLTRLVENVLDFARIEDGRKQYRFERIETGGWLRELAGIASQRRSVSTELPEALPAVEGDRDALSSAVLNLLDNAIKYSPEGVPVELQASGEDGWVTIGVRDRGCGIAPEEQRRIFDRFYRGAHTTGGAAQGVGLGLALVKRIADAHGARLRVESAPGEGSTFYLSLRAAA